MVSNERILVDDIQCDEAAEAIKSYLLLFDHNCYDFQYHFTENCVLDWYGYSIYGANRVHQYLRQKISMKLNHLEFQDGKETLPIESTNIHYRTRKISDKSIDYIHRLNRVDRMKDSIPLKRMSGSDDEIDHFENKNSKTNSHWSSSDDDEIDYGKRLKMEDCKRISSYSSIRYAEAHGKVNYESLLIGTASTSMKSTRLRISYRRNLVNNEIQFILVIYEDMKMLIGDVYKPSARCNLMKKIAEYTEFKDSKNNQDGDGHDVSTFMGRIVTNAANVVTTPLSGRMSPCEEGITPIIEDEDNDTWTTKIECTTPIRRMTKVSSIGAMTTIPEDTQIIANNIGLFDGLNNADVSLDYSMAQLRTPTKLRPSPLISPVRKPRSTSCKRTTSPLKEPTPKRSAARSLRL